MVSEDSKWSVLHGEICGLWEICSVNTYHYYFLGDTTLDEKAYKKVFQCTDSLLTHCELVGFIREDLPSKKVWYRKIGKEEKLLYDFDLSKGDTLEMYHEQLKDTIKYTVSRIDTIHVGSSIRNRYTLDILGWEDTWIEGIGSKFGLLNSNLYYNIVGSFADLLCFSDNQGNYYNPEYDACHVTEFPPLIEPLALDTAFSNEVYIFPLEISGIKNYEGVEFFMVGTLPAGLTFDNDTGLISGVPTETGVFPLIICVKNNGLTTDCLETDLVVKLGSGINNTGDKREVNVYPNPALNHFTIEIQGNQGERYIEIVGARGEKVIGQSLNSNLEIIKTGDLARGIYYLIVMDKDSGRVTHNEKLILN